MTGVASNCPETLVRQKRRDRRVTGKERDSYSCRLCPPRPTSVSRRLITTIGISTTTNILRYYLGFYEGCVESEFLVFYNKCSYEISI